MKKVSNNIMAVVIISILFGTILMSGCLQSEPDGKTTIPKETEKNPEVISSMKGKQDMVGSWRVYSSRLFYDKGGGGSMGRETTQLLDLNSDSTYSFGSSGGSWSVVSISPDDWKRWGIEPYGPTKKIILSGWDGGTADGPIEEFTRVDFIWVLYKVKPPTVSAPGTVEMKFGHAINDEEPAPSQTPPQTNSAFKAVAGVYRCDGCDTRQPLVLKEDGSWTWADTVGTFTVESGKVVFRSPYAGGSGWASQGGAADWGPAEIGNGILTFAQNVRWVRNT